MVKHGNLSVGRKYVAIIRFFEYYKLITTAQLYCVCVVMPVTPKMFSDQITL